jgi:hypothetical protein
VNNRSYVLPGKIGTYLRRLDLEYGRTGDLRRQEIIRHARVLVIEKTTYDNWNGGTTGHDAVFFLPEKVLSAIGLPGQSEIEEGLRADLNSCSARFEAEFFNAARLDLADDSEPEYQQARPFSLRPLANPENLTIWKPGQIRLFISHRDRHKRAATELAEALQEYGISSFVAHDTIEPTREWRREILNGLETMEVMLVFLTDDFEESTWTNQEVGFALGKGVPVVSLKLESRDPPGFVSHEQALRGSLSNPASSAQAVQKLIAEKLGRTERIQTALIEAFLASPDWNEARDRFERMSAAIDRLNDANLNRILEGFSKNDQLYRASYLVNSSNRLVRFLERTTNKRYVVAGRTIQELVLKVPGVALENAISF